MVKLGAKAHLNLLCLSLFLIGCPGSTDPEPVDCDPGVSTLRSELRLFDCCDLRKEEPNAKLRKTIESLPIECRTPAGVHYAKKLGVCTEAINNSEISCPN